MRIKEEFKRFGDFWLPSTPERKVPGILSVSDGGVVELELFDRLDENTGSMEREQIERIVGYIEKHKFVTLDDCYYLRKSISSIGKLRSLIRVKRTFIGAKYDNGVNPQFNTLTFSIEGIDEWVGKNGIQVESKLEEHTTTISYKRPAEVSFDLANGMRFSVAFAEERKESFLGPREIKLTQKAYFKLVSQEARELDEFISIVRKITALLCFAIDEIVCLDSIYATSENLCVTISKDTTEPTPVHIYYSSWFYSKNEPVAVWDWMLFGFDDVDAQQVINKWIKAYEDIEPVFDLYFLAKIGAYTSLEAKFLALIQGLEAFHRRTSDEKHIEENEFKEIVENMIQKCPENERSWFNQKLNYANELTLRNRVTKLIETFDEGISGKEKSKLISSIVDTRNYLTHYDSSLESKAAKGKELQNLCITMGLLYQLHFLKLIGFRQEDIGWVIETAERNLLRKLES